jgi:hypothetical protein
MRRQVTVRSRSVGRRTVLGDLWCVKGKAFSLVLIAVIFGLIGCAQPTFVPDTTGGPAPLLHEAPGVLVAVETNAWKGRPSGLRDTVLPLLVTMRNTGTQPVGVSRHDFVLLDQTNRQYAPLHPVDVLAMFGGGGGSGVGISPSIGIGGSSRGGSVVGGGLGVTFGSWGTDTRDIVPLALSEGPIHPGAEARGFLYFPRPAPEAGDVRLVATLRDVPGAPQLEFQFRRAQ